MYILMTYFTLFLTVSPLELKLQPATSRSFHSCFFLAFSLTLTNIFVRFNPISWWSCTIAGRVCASHWARKPKEAQGAQGIWSKAARQRPKGWTVGKGNLFGAHADDDNKFECQMMPSWFPWLSDFLAFWLTGAGFQFRLTWFIGPLPLPEGVLSQISCIRLLLI